MICIADALESARQSLPANEARLLLGYTLERSPAWLLAHHDHVLDETQRSTFDDLVVRRLAGEPIAYLIGRREFYGREFLTSPAVLIPRPETELLVDIALAGIDARMASRSAGCSRLRVLDLGTGSGCIAITLALERTHVDVIAIDQSPEALAVARANTARLRATLRFLESDWFDALEGQFFDLIVANPPYIRAADPHLGQGDLRFEPLSALSSGEAGQDALLRIIEDTPAHLAAQGELWLEHGYDQADVVRTRLIDAGFGSVEQHLDLAGIARVSGGRWSK